MTFERYVKPSDISSLTMSIIQNKNAPRGLLKIAWGINFLDDLPSSFKVLFGKHKDFGKLQLIEGSDYKLSTGTQKKKATIQIFGVTAHDCKTVKAISCEWEPLVDKGYLVTIPEQILDYLLIKEK